MRTPAIVLASILLAGGGACTSVSQLEREPSEPTPIRGMVVCEHPLAAAVGVRVLEAGGNAADAAVATALALAVVYPQAGNLGGGGFALFVPHVGSATTIDFREKAPAGFVPALYLDENGEVVAERSLVTPLAVGVPGSPAGLHMLYERHGSKKLTFADLCDGAIYLAEEGFHVDEWLARDLESRASRQRLGGNAAARALFYPEGEPLAEGALLRQPELAATLALFARRGPASFYEGDVAKKILVALGAADFRWGSVAGPASMTREDLAQYRPEVRPPVVGWFRGVQVFSMGPPSSGGIVLLQVLSILGGFPLDAERQKSEAEDGLTARAVHWWIEAMRRAFADRAAHLGDPDHYPVPVAELLAPEWIARRRVSIGERANHAVAARVLAPPPESSQTTHVSVIDREGNAVSLTTTLNDTFGSGILVPGAGFLLNNELDDFSIQPGTPNMYGLVGSEANQLRGGKRPLSSMTPTVVRDGGRRISLVLGAPGGPRIITAVAQVLLRVLVYGESLEDAVRAPRLHQQWRPAATRFELGWDPALLDALRLEYGHELDEPEARYFGSVQAIQVRENGEPVGVSDPRRGGVAGAEGFPLPRPARPDEPLRPAVPRE